MLVPSGKANLRPKGEYASFTAKTTKVSNLFRFLRFRSSASGSCQGAAFAFGIRRKVVPYYRSLSPSAPPSSPPGLCCGTPPSSPRGGEDPAQPTPPTNPLHPVHSMHSLPPSYRDCWHGHWSKLGPRRISLPTRVGLYDRSRPHPCDIAGSRLRALTKILDCCLPMEWNPCLSVPVADRSPNPARGRRLGRPFPPQLPALPTAPLPAPPRVSPRRPFPARRPVIGDSNPEGSWTRPEDRFGSLPHPSAMDAPSTERGAPKGPSPRRSGPSPTATGVRPRRRP